MSIQKFETELAGKKLTIETGKLAEQADGSCTVQYGETVVLATAVISQNIREGIDYFPLLIDFEEKYYASGKIKGSRFITPERQVIRKNFLRKVNKTRQEKMVNLQKRK